MFSARRKPKRIARDDTERNSHDEDEDQDSSSPVVRRPNLAPKSKSKSKLRTSFAPDEADDSSDAPVIVKPKPRTAHTSSSTQSLPRFNTESRPNEDPTLRPSYSKTALEELRNSTPSTPKALSVYDPSSGAEEGIRDLDITSKFGLKPTTSVSSSAIPSASEIAEKKSRRARLAKETGGEDFIALDDDTLYDSDGEFKPRRMQVGTYLRADPVEAETRLVRDDEDMLEGFDEFTEDAESKRLTMGRKQLLQEQRRDRDAMREMIEGHSSESSESDSEVERNRAYETAQTAHGMDGLSGAKAAQRKGGVDRPRQPREVTPVPKLAVALGKLRERIAKVEIERVKVERRRGEIKKEKVEIVASQEHIQRSLIEAGEELNLVRKRQAEEERLAVNENRDGTAGGGMKGRGLDSMGLTTEPT